ncbi:MAG: HD domain-containing protein [Treponema sp.]|nr:HD domain-containing protein [Candidatus Treponema caballi]
MPFEFRKSIAEKNYLRTLYGLLFTLFASIVAFFILYFADRAKIFEIGSHELFLTIYIHAAILSLFIMFLIRKFNIKNICVIEFPLYFCATVGTLDCLLSLLRQTGVFNALIFFLFLEILISIVYTFHPIYFFLLTTLSYLNFYPNIKKQFGGMAAYTTLLLFVTLIFLCLSKWKNTKRLLLRSSNGDLYKEALQSEVQRQMNEINRQHKKIVKMQNHTIVSLSNLVENRDSDTGEHVRRTSKYVKLLAQKAKQDGYYKDILTDDYINYLYRAAPMHDIGKIIISDVILKKPGKLTDEEFFLMQKHCSEGGRIVREVLGNDQDKEYVTIATEIASYHHEKWNGCGYPSKLKEEEIPLSARIMAIADVFDALVSPRCYKEPYPVEKAFSIIQEDAGKHFDPILAKEFLEIKDSVLEVFNHFKD